MRCQSLVLLSKGSVVSLGWCQKAVHLKDSDPEQGGKAIKEI